MFIDLGESIGLRRPEMKDVEQIYQYRNDWAVIKTLGGFSYGMSRQNVQNWIEKQRTNQRDIVWAIAAREGDECIGHAGLYDIDYRIRKAELGVCLGNRAFWGRGLGSKVYVAVLDFGFKHLNLHRIETFNLATNTKTEHIKQKLGFQCEGEMRDVQFRDGQYINVRIWAVLEDDWDAVDVAGILAS